VTHTIRYWNEAQFAGGEHTWQSLLARSNADPLFNSWAWMYGWWQHHCRSLKAQLRLGAIYNDDVLVGLVPMYMRQVMHRGVVPGWRIEMMGSAWRESAAVFSEYSDIVADKAYASDVVDIVANSLNADKRWTDFVVPNTDTNSLLTRLVRDRLPAQYYVRETDPMTAYVAKLPEKFEQYVHELDGGVRRKVWNHRSKLTSPELRVRSGDVEEFFDQMNSLHEKRWGHRHYEGVPRQLHLQFAHAAAKSRQLRLSELRVGGEIVSLMYNIRIGRKEYNLQSAFDGSRFPGISLGYLHLGYAMESACAEGVTEFDLLGGSGKSRDYKKDFKTITTQLVSFQTIRSGVLAWLYKAYDKRFAKAACMGIPWIFPLTDESGALSFLSAWQ